MLLPSRHNVYVPMPIASMVHEFYKSCLAHGLGDEDHANIIKVFEKMAEIEVKAGNYA